MQKIQNMVSKGAKHLFTITSTLYVPRVYERFLFHFTQCFSSPCWMISCWTNFEFIDFIMSIQWLDPVISIVWILTFGLLSSKTLWNTKQNPGHICLHGAMSFFQGWTLLHHLLFEDFLLGPEFAVVCLESWSWDCSFKSGTRIPKHS